MLELAEDPDLPLLARARFLAIFASNLDEFFMVRVAGLKRRIATGIAVRAASGMMPGEVLDGLWARTRELMLRQVRCFHDELLPALTKEGIELLRWDELNDDDRAKMAGVFQDRIFPVLTPLAVDPAHPFPYISGPVAQPRGRRAQPDHRHGALRPGEGAAAARALRPGREPSASSRSRTSSPRTSTSCSPAWRCCRATASASPATRTSRSRRTTPRTC